MTRNWVITLEAELHLYIVGKPKDVKCWIGDTWLVCSGRKEKRSVFKVSSQKYFEFQAEGQLHD